MEYGIWDMGVNMWIIKYDKGNGVEDFSETFSSKEKAERVCIIENEFKPNVKHWVEKCESEKDTLNKVIEYLRNEQKIICYDEKEIEGYESEYHKQGFEDAIIGIEKFMKL